MTDFGVYLHVPFCRHRCDYCAFATWTDRDGLIDRYLAACRTHVEQAVAEGLPPVTSVFVGGGTPTRVPPQSLMAVLEPLPLTDDAEVTVETNPDDVTGELLTTYRDGGVTRVSLGVQSLEPTVLEALGRTHDPANVRRAVELIKATGFASWNLDLIYGAAGETIDHWTHTLEAALAFEPPHVSAYALTVEPGTRLAEEHHRHPDDDDQADKYLLATELLGAADLEWYEISNWAKPGHECRHNLLYWSQGEYAAIGCAAHGHRSGRRYWNVRTPERYVHAIERGASPEAADERLLEDEKRLEGLQLALRTLDGVPASALPVDDLGDLVKVRNGRARLTVAGRLMANEVAIRLR
nr:hemN_rel: putative oxygen-independent coproporphyrinogen III [uncultured bacterium]